MSIAKRKTAAQDEFARIFAKREAAIELLLKYETKLKHARRTLVRLEKAERKQKTAADNWPPDLLNDSLEIPGFVRKGEV